MEQDNEVKGNTNSLDFGARIYDPRLGRWLSVDPLVEKFPHISPYAFADNNPIFFVDENGEEPTPAAYKRAAEKLGVSVAHLRAVYKSEVGAGGYLKDGRIIILYEKHYFKKNTRGKYDESNPDISGDYGDKYGTWTAQYDKFEKAAELDMEAACMSISIGGFQIMGENFKEAGSNSAKEFVDAMMNGTEDDHLEAFTNFIKNSTFAPEGKTKLAALKEGDWAKFARNYNGPDYKANKYDEKMKNYYEEYKDDPYKGLDMSEKSTEADDFKSHKEAQYEQQSIIN